jgi:hypothetical protein
MRLASRLTNLVLTAQTQVAYACFEDTRRWTTAQINQLEAAWPESPVRDALTVALRTQERSAKALEDQLLTAARQRSGLAFAKF